MFVTQEAQCQSRRQGCRPVSLAELRRRMATSTGLNEEQRQRLQDLQSRLARLVALGGEYARVEMSEFVTAAMDRRVAAV